MGGTVEQVRYVQFKVVQIEPILEAGDEGFDAVLVHFQNISEVSVTVLSALGGMEDKRFLWHYSCVIEDINHDSKYLTSIKWKMTCHWFSGASDYYQTIQIETIQIEWYFTK